MRWLPETTTGATGFERAFGLRPDLFAACRDFAALFWEKRLLDPTLLELCRLRVGQMLGPALCDAMDAARAALPAAKKTQLGRWWSGDAYTAFLRSYGTLWSHGVVDQMTKEIARICNARRVDCPICKAIRFAGAKREGLTEDQVDRIRDDWAERDLAPRHKAALRAVDAFSKIAVALGGLPDEIPVHEQPTPVVPAG